MAASLQAAATLMKPAKVGGLGRSNVQQLRSSQIVCKAFGEEVSGRPSCALQAGMKELALKCADAAKVAGFALAASALIASVCIRQACSFPALPCSRVVVVSP